MSSKPAPQSSLPAWRRFLRDPTAATAIEYALISAGIGIAIVATVSALGSSVNTLFSTVATSLK